MKKRILLSAAIITAVIFTGCSEKVPETPHEIKQDLTNTANNLPDWVQNPKVDNAISAIGIASYSKHGIPAMLPEAEMDARAKLAGKIQTIVSQLQQRALRKTKLNSVDEFETSFKEVTKEVIKEIPISGARRIKLHQAKDGTLYVQMIIEKKEITQNLEDMKLLYKQNTKQSKQNLDDGMTVIDSMIEELNVEL